MGYETLSRVREDYLDWMKARRLGQRTIKNKLQILNHASDIWGNPVVRRIKPEDVTRLFDQGQWGPSTANLYMGNLRGFFQYCRDTAICPPDFDPTRGWRNARVPRKKMYRLPKEDIPALLDAAEHPRDRMVVAVGLYTLARGSEIREMRWDNFNLNSGVAEFYQIKNKRDHMLPIIGELDDELRSWQAWVEERHGPIQPHWLLTPKQRRGNFSGPQGELIPSEQLELTNPLMHIYEAANRTFHNFGVDIPRQTGNHALRRSGARVLLDFFRQMEGEQSALLRVSSMLGHADIKDTIKYIGLDIENDQLMSKLKGVRILDEPKSGLRAVG